MTPTIMPMAGAGHACYNWHSVLGQVIRPQIADTHQYVMVWSGGGQNTGEGQEGTPLHSSLHALEQKMRCLGRHEQRLHVYLFFIALLCGIVRF